MPPRDGEEKRKCFLLYGGLSRGFLPLYRAWPPQQVHSIWQARTESTKCSPSLQISLSLLRNVGPAFECDVVGPKGFGLLQGTLQLASNISATNVESRTERKAAEFDDTPMSAEQYKNKCCFGRVRRNISQFCVHIYITINPGVLETPSNPTCSPAEVAARYVLLPSRPRPSPPQAILARMGPRQASSAFVVFRKLVYWP